MKRILLLLATNLAVILVLTIVLKLLGIDDRLAAAGHNVESLFIGAAVFGFRSQWNNAKEICNESSTLCADF